ncbi:MAG: hypothetical protein JW971_04785 [Synergistales bacterium]|nr:hypothetical protein [Synergistales bacterium]
MNFKDSRIFWCCIAIVFFLSAAGLVPRWNTEGHNRTSAIVMDYRDLTWMADSSSSNMADTMDKMIKAGISGIMVKELTGEELSQGFLPARLGRAGSFPLLQPLLPLDEHPRAALYIPDGWEYGPKAEKYLKLRFPDTREVRGKDGKFVVLREAFADLMYVGVLPDLEGLGYGERSPLNVIYRPSPSPGLKAESVILPLEEVLSDHGAIRCIAPAGDVVAGYPEVRGLAELAKKRDLAVVQVEFSRQLGAPNLNWASYPGLLSMHSVTPEEMLARKISRQVLSERMLRAAKERSVRLLLWRPSHIESSDSVLEETSVEVAALASTLLSRGITLEWPQVPEHWRKNIFSVFAPSLMLMVVLYLYLHRVFPGIAGSDARKKVLVLVLLTLIAGLSAWKISMAGRLLGLLVAVFTATEASLSALEGTERPWSGLLRGFIIALAGGLSIAAFFGDPFYMLRLKTFSGVKATLLLPALLVLFHDLKRRIHDESLSGIFSRPPLWGELVLLLVLMTGAGITLLRSGNVQLVPGWEVDLRDLLERLLVARPRNKELFIGYPSIMLWYLFRKKDIWPHYREVFRIGGTLAFSTMVNSFCHFHTRLYFTLWREFNGLWSGVLMGLLVVLVFSKVLIPLWGRYKGVLMD